MERPGPSAILESWKCLSAPSPLRLLKQTRASWVKTCLISELFCFVLLEWNVFLMWSCARVVLLCVSYSFLALHVSQTEEFVEEGHCKSKGCSESSQPRAESQQIRQEPSETDPTNREAEETVESTGMEWRAHGSSNDDLVTQLKRVGIIKSDRVEDAMRRVERGNYSPKSPYVDSPQHIGYGVTISAPHMHAHALEMLRNDLKEGNVALDVGSGNKFNNKKKNILK